MKFHYAGKYDGNEESLPQREHPENAVPFREPNMKQLAIIANIGAIISTITLLIPVVILGRQHFGFSVSVGVILSIFTLIPHEFLHALCFKEDVYMYENLKQGLMFVVGTEDMSKRRFILMSLCPNLVFGFIPYIIFLFVPRFVGLGFFAAICIGMGFGDYINVFNAIRQMPKGSKTYLSGMHSYWYV